MGLDDIRIKLDRAKEHLDALNTEIDRFATTNPYPLHVVSYKGTNQVRDIVWLRKPPPRWSALAGDCVHNLRSALDHIVWSLSGGDGMAPTHTEFPIFKDENKYLDRTGKGDPARGSGLWKIEGVQSFQARTAIRWLQPFRGPDPTGHPLWILHELDRIDKHRRLHVVVGWAYANLSRRGIRDSSELEPGWRQTYATQSPEYPAKTLPGQKPQVKMRYDLALRVAVKAEAVRADENVDVVLRRLGDFVETEVLGSLKGFL